jgi:hypothetical protein
VLQAIFAGLGGALVGSAVGFAGAVYIERWRLRRTRLGILRALAGELRRNAARLALARYSGRATRPAVETWTSVNSQLAQLLDQQLYEDILFLYMTLHDVIELSRIPVDSRQADLATAWLDRYHAVVNELLALLPERMRFPIARDADPEPNSPAQPTLRGGP